MEWHDITDPASPELDQLAQRYGIHALHIEDCRHRNQNAKVEATEHYLFVVLKTVDLKSDEMIEIGDLDLFLGADFVITVQEAICAPARLMLDNLRRSYGQAPADQILYRVFDGIVDSYLPVLDHFSESIDTLSGAVLESPSPEVLSRIFTHRRCLVELRRILSNMRDAANHLMASDHTLLPRELWPFLRDIYDHLARNLDTVDVQRELLTSSMDIYLSSVANRTNLVMKVLTVLSTIALPALLVSSFFGMNLKGLPWADSPNGTIYAGMFMAGMTVMLLGILKIFRWL